MKLKKKKKGSISIWFKDELIMINKCVLNTIEINIDCVNYFIHLKCRKVYIYGAFFIANRIVFYNCVFRIIAQSFYWRESNGV